MGIEDGNKDPLDSPLEQETEDRYIREIKELTDERLSVEAETLQWKLGQVETERKIRGYAKDKEQ